MNNHLSPWESNCNLFDSELLSVNDVLLRPGHGIVKSRSEIDTNNNYIMSAPMDKVTGYELCKVMLAHGQSPVLSRFIDPEERTKAILEFAGEDNFWIAVSADYKKEQEYLWDLVKNKRINICVDVAHGSSQEMGVTYYNWRQLPNVIGLMSGSIATPEAAFFCIELGCTHLRVGIGPGSACTTRLVTGVGYPQLSAVFEIKKRQMLKDKSEIKIIADGGISTSGDIVKYLSAGADMVMLGKMLSYAEESCGWETNVGLKRKKYRGQASKSFQQDLYGKSNHVEGESSKDYYHVKYTFNEFLNEMNDGITSAISYLGLNKFSALSPSNVKFMRITQNSWNESNTNL